VEVTGITGLRIWGSPGAAIPERVGAPAPINRERTKPGISVSKISYHSVDGAKFKGPSMSIKFEGKPPFYLGIAEVASAHALDGSVVLRATISVPELRPKSVPVQFILAIDVAKALAEQLPIAVRTEELQKLQGG
jgi:hypothetical protein